MKANEMKNLKFQFRTMNTKKITFVSAGIKVPKKESSKKCLYLNYGMLGLATNLHKKGYNVKMYQGDYNSVDTTLSKIGDTVDTNYPIFLSVPSFLALSWAEEFVKKAKKIYNTKIVLGGRWTIDNNLEWIKNKLPDVDFFSLGCPDDVIDKLIFPENWETYASPQKYSAPFGHLEYTLLNDFQKYQPVIEVSRGCGSGCEFCLESKFKLCGMKKPAEIIEEAKYLAKIYNDNSLNIYFEASHFNPKKEWAIEFAKLYKKSNANFKWRCTSRVDTFKPEIAKILSETNLKVVDLGLESASIDQLERMNKSRNPKEYLNKAAELIKTMSEVGIWAKLNILLYAGETSKTIEETTAWLAKNKCNFKGISANPLSIYRNGSQTQSFIDEVETISQIKVSPSKLEELEKNGITYPDLSCEISYEKAKKIAKELAKKFMSPQDFSDLKEICYTSRIKTEKKKTALHKKLEIRSQSDNSKLHIIHIKTYKNQMVKATNY